MKAEEQLFSLMAIAEEQQRLITQSIEEQTRSTKALVQQQQVFLETLQAKQSEVQSTFERNVADLNQQLSRQVGWSRIFLTSLLSLLLSGVVIGGLFVYLQDMQNEIQASRSALSQLEGYNADLSVCTRDGEELPCVRVMRSWGGYGEDADYFILDPK